MWKTKNVHTQIKLSYFLRQWSNLKLECKFDVGSENNYSKWGDMLEIEPKGRMREKKYAVFETLASCLQCFVLAEAGHFSTLSWALTESKVRSMTCNFWQSNEKIETHKIPVSFYFGEPQDIVACFCSFLLQVDEVKKKTYSNPPASDGLLFFVVLFIAIFTISFIFFFTMFVDFALVFTCVFISVYSCGFSFGLKTLCAIPMLFHTLRTIRNGKYKIPFFYPRDLFSRSWNVLNEVKTNIFKHNTIYEAVFCCRTSGTENFQVLIRFSSVLVHFLSLAYMTVCWNLLNARFSDMKWKKKQLFFLPAL